MTAETRASGGTTDQVVYRISTTLEGRTIVGSDSGIMVVPDELYVQVGAAKPALNVHLLHRMLRRFSTQSAADLGVRLHHAEWVITSDPDVVEEWGIHSPDCLPCRAGVDQALAHLAHGGGPLLVGMLYWAG